jgi:RAT1-interacting protein
VNTDPGANFNSVVQTTIGDLRMIVCGEVDCYSADPPEQNYLELKTARLFSTDRGRENFEKHKLLKYWAQSFTVGVPRVVVGFRDEKGIVRKNQRFHTLKIPQLVAGREEEMWDHKICLNFMHGLLAWVYRTVVDDEPWLLRFDGFGATSVTLQRGVARKPHCIFDEALCGCIEAAPPPTQGGAATSRGSAK